jgi:hypothetical protein
VNTRCFPPALAVLLVLLVLALVASPAIADGVYPSQHIALTPVGDFPLRTGFVQNIHANGPVIFAHENYVLNGAAANTTFDVYLLVHPDSACAYQVAELNTASLTTNVAGNGSAQAIIPPEMAPRDVTLFLLWELRIGDTSAYRTVCSMVTMD